MNNQKIVICGAGIAGIATAYYLLKNNKNLDVLLIDKNQPLSFTTSKSGENFRDFWPQKPMMEFSSRSIDLMKSLKSEYGDDAFKMTFSGYNFISLDKQKPIFSATSEETNVFIEEICDAETIQKEYSCLSKAVAKIVKIKNAGAIDVYALGSLMLKEAKKLGLKVIEGEVVAIDKTEVDFQIHLNTKTIINAQKVVIAAGPFINHLANMVGLSLPIENVLQQKFIIPDPKNIIPKDMPFTIYADSQYLDWSEAEADFFAADENYKWLLQQFPGGLHIKPESGGIKLGWAFNTEKSLPNWQPFASELFPKVVLKGASRFIPQLIDYEDNIPTPIVQYAGYYTRTKENYPLIGSTKIPNIFLVGALAGYGTMTACAAGELCSKYILEESDLPNYAPYFHLSRYENETLMREIEASQSDGQL